MSSTAHVLSNGALGGQPSNASPPVAPSAEASSLQSPIVIPPPQQVGETERRFAEAIVRSLRSADGRSIIRVSSTVQTVYCIYGRNDNDGRAFVVSVGDGVDVRNQGETSPSAPIHMVSEPSATKIVQDAVAAHYYAHRSSIRFDFDRANSGDTSEIETAGFKVVCNGSIDESTHILLVVPTVFGGNPKNGPMSGLAEVFISKLGAPFAFTDTVFDNTHSLTARPSANFDPVKTEGIPRLPYEFSALFQYVVREVDGKVFGRLVAHTNPGGVVSRITWYPGHGAAPLTTIWSPDLAV